VSKRCVHRIKLDEKQIEFLYAIPKPQSFTIESSQTSTSNTISSLINSAEMQQENSLTQAEAGAGRENVQKIASDQACIICLSKVL